MSKQSFYRFLPEVSGPLASVIHVLGVRLSSAWKVGSCECPESYRPIEDDNASRTWSKPTLFLYTAPANRLPKRTSLERADPDQLQIMIMLCIRVVRKHVSPSITFLSRLAQSCHPSCSSCLSSLLLKLYLSQHVLRVCRCAFCLNSSKSAAG